jgi:hypothetical protein
MAEKDFVRAMVVDIRGSAAAPPEQIALDAGILYFFYYPSFEDLKLAGGALPARYQLEAYRSWLADALSSDVELITSRQTLGEFARLCEYAEIEARWLTSPGRAAADTFSAKLCKEERYQLGPVDLATVRRRVRSFVDSVCKNVALLPQAGSAEAAHAAAVSTWTSSAGDYADAALVSEAKQAGIFHVLADDIDLLWFDGITVWTANSRAVNAARDVGKVIAG